MSFNRSDITVAVTTDGEMYIAQGNPSLAKLPDEIEYELGLYHSQLHHRCAALSPGGWMIMTPSEAIADGLKWTRFPSQIYSRATGSPYYCGQAGQ